MKLIFHIGTEKTGTTAMQFWLHENTAYLRDHGIWNAQCLDLPNHRKISVLARDPDLPEDGFRLYGIHSPEDHAEFCKTTIAALEADVMAAKKAGMHTYVISSEHCQSRLRTQTMVNRTAALLKPMFEKIEIYVFLRPQVDTALSLASTGSRVGMYIGPRYFDRVTPDNPYYNFSDLLTRWAVAYGKWNVRPVPFKRNPSPIEYFKTRFELPADAELIEAKRVNEKLDYRVVAFINLLVGKGQKLRPARHLPKAKRSVSVEGLECETPLLLSRPDARALNKIFLPTNRVVVRDWLGIEIEDLTPDFERFPVEGNIDKLETADVTPVLQEIVGRFNAEHALAKARAEYLESQLAQRDGDLGKALAHMRTAVGDLEMALEVAFTQEWAQTQANNFAYRIKELERLRDLPADARHDAPPAAQIPANDVPPPAAETSPPAAMDTPAPTDGEGRRGSGLRSVLKGIVPRRS